MRLLVAAVVGLGMVLSWPASAHLCNNIYRTPDRLVIKPEKDVATIEKNDEFRVFIKNNYPEKVDNVRLSGKADGEGIAVVVTPDVIPRLKPGEKSAFTVQIVVSPNAGRGKHTLSFSISAAQVGFEAAGDAPAQDLYRAVKEDNPSPGVYAAETLVQRRDPAGRKAFESYITGGRGGRDYACRALRALGRAGDVSLAPLAVQCLGSQDGQIKGNALLALGLLDVGQDILAQLGQFAQSRDPFVSTCAQAALAMHGDQTVSSALKAALNASDAYVRTAAAFGLVMGKDQDAVTVLDRALGDGNAEIVVLAGDALVSAAQKQDGTQGWSEAPASGTDTATAALTEPPTAQPAASGTTYATTDKLSYKIEPPVSPFGRSGQVKVLLYHRYPTPLHHVTFKPDESVATLQQPAVIAELKPTSTESVTLALALASKPAGERTTVPVTISADELQTGAIIDVPVPMTEQAAAAINKELSVPVGTTIIQVLPFSNLLIYLCGVAVLVGVGLVIWRTRRSNRSDCSGGNCAVAPLTGWR